MQFELGITLNTVNVRGYLDNKLYMEEKSQNAHIVRQNILLRTKSGTKEL
jgi:hypothetical protein